MPGFDLNTRAREFAGQLSSLLNTTVCTGVRLTPVTAGSSRVVVGYRISKTDQDSRTGIPLTISSRAPSAFLGLSYRLAPDDAGRHLMVVSSVAGVFADEHLDRPLVHYDYERDKEDGYPEAHLQFGGESGAWDEIAARRGLAGRPLERLHFPVGGRRFRPTLEDLIDFTITEGLADARPEAMEDIRRERAAYHELQLRAAVRRNPDVALEVLRAEGHIV